MDGCNLWAYGRWREEARAHGRTIPSLQALSHRGIRLTKLVRGLGIPNRPPELSDDEMLAILVQACHVIGLDGLSRDLYDRWRAERSDSPSRQGLAERFGSWSAALVSAGVPQFTGTRRYSDAELLAAIREAADGMGVEPKALTTSGYEQWQAENGETKVITITKRFKRWSTARQAVQSIAIGHAHTRPRGRGARGKQANGQLSPGYCDA